MLRHLDRMREMPEDVTDHPTLDEELCWDEPKPPSTDEVHGSLLMEIGNRPGIRNLQIAVYWNDEHRHFGTFELAVDDETDEACGLSRSRILPASRLIGPAWSQSGANFDETIRIFINTFPLQQLEALNEDCINEMLAAKVA